MSARGFFYSIGLFVWLGTSASALAHPTKPNLPKPQFYRDLTLKLRTSGTFRSTLPVAGGDEISYSLKLGKPVYAEPIMLDFQLDPEKPEVFRDFVDRVLLEDGSYVKIGSETLPLTCVFIDGRDNRWYDKGGPQFPDIIMKVILVANDYSCLGPINPGFPGNGGKQETWDTYFQYKIVDPTIMLPTEPMVRYRWAEVPAILIDAGGNP